MPDALLDRLRALAHDALPRAYVPYTRRPEAAVVLLADGTWAPGVRVENAAFPLLIPAPIAAAALARIHGSAPPVAVAMARAITPAERAVLADDFGIDWDQPKPDVLLAPGVRLPHPRDAVDPYLAIPHDDPAAELAAAERMASKAYIPASNFPVGCALLTTDGRWIGGANVEHPDWTRGLCAERVALAVAHAYGHPAYRRMVLTCPLDPTGTPCGACRQVLAELAPGVPIRMARGADAPETTTPEALLPGAFRGDHLRA